jgi:MOSC domain-containing protein YiiM
MPDFSGNVIAVCRDSAHRIGKPSQVAIRLLAGLGVEGDAHCGATVRHRYLAARDPARPNLRQIHLIQHELLDELAASGMAVQPGAMGENITTAGLDLTALPLGTTLRLGRSASVQVTGLRNPCRLLDRVHPGLMRAVSAPGPGGRPTMLRAAIMGVVIEGGDVHPGDAIAVMLPRPPFAALPVL